MKKEAYAYEKGYRVSKEGVIISYTGKLLKTYISNGYYKKVSIRYCNKVVSVSIHRLQAYQKYKHLLFEKGVQVRHLNGNSLDNSYCNILIGSASENAMDKPKEVRVRGASHPKHPHANIKKDRRSGMTYKQLMSKYSISSKGTISFIINKSLSM